MSNETNTKRNPWKAVVAAVSKDGRTARVEVSRTVQHAKYGKRLTRQTSLQVDTSGRPLEVGNVVEILPCRKMAKNKSWRVVSVAGNQ